jgi:hypothetical protein
MHGNSALNSPVGKGSGAKRHMGKNMGVASADDPIIRPGGTFTRKQAVDFLGMNDTEFALRLTWDAEFPKAEEGSFRAADVVAWMRARRAGPGKRAPVRDR